MRFGRALKIGEKFGKAKTNLKCLSYSGIDHNRLGEYGDRAVQCIICANAYNIKNYKYGVTSYTIMMGKINTHIIPKCTNYGVKHQTITFRCPARLKV